MRKSILRYFVGWMLVAVASMAVAWIIWGRAGRVTAMQPPRVFAATKDFTPYYVHQANYSHHTDGSVVLTSYETFARRSDGSTFEKSETVSPEGKMVNSTRRFRLAGGLVIDTEDVAGLMTAMRLPNGEERRNQAQWDPGAQCAKTFGGSSLPAWSIITEEPVLGFPAFRAVTDTPRVRTTVWRARDIGCAILKGKMEFKDSSGQVTGWSEATADIVQPGEPPADFFALPLTLRNVPPSERAKGNPLNIGKEVPEGIQSQDELFAKHRTSLR